MNLNKNVEYIKFPPQENYKYYMLYKDSSGSSNARLYLRYFNIDDPIGSLKLGSSQKEWHYYNPEGFDTKLYYLHLINNNKPICNKQWTLSSTKDHTIFLKDYSCINSKPLRDKLLSKGYDYKDIQLGNPEEYSNKFIEGTGCNIRIEPSSNPNPPIGQGVSKQQEFNFINKTETMKYIQGQDITISCEIETDEATQFEKAGILFQYKIDESEEFQEVRAEVTGVEEVTPPTTGHKKRIGKYRVWATFRLP